MKQKKRRTGLYIALGICAIVLLFWCMYSRPLSLDYLCKGLDLSTADRVQYTYAIAETESGRLSSDYVTVTLESGDPAINRILHELNDTAYRRKLSSFLPETAQTHLLKEGDFSWEITVTGDFLLRVNNFYGKIEVDYETKTSSKHWVCSIDDEAWLQNVLNLLTAHAE